jgi:hypothetical protein
MAAHLSRINGAEPPMNTSLAGSIPGLVHFLLIGTRFLLYNKAGLGCPPSRIHVFQPAQDDA